MNLTERDRQLRKILILFGAIFVFSTSLAQEYMTASLNNRSLSDTEVKQIHDKSTVKLTWMEIQYEADVVSTTKPFLKSSDASALTTEMLNSMGFINVNATDLCTYQLLIETNFSVDASTPIETVLTNNHAAIQAIIDNENASSTAGTRALNKKDILSGTYPRAFIFRRTEQTSRFATYEDWEQNNLLLDGIAGKTMNEELVSINSYQNCYWFNRYALENPEKVTFLHFNGRSRDPRWETGKFFAGHWLYHPGTTLSKAITAQDTIFKVSSTTGFKIGYGLNYAKKNDDIIIIPVDKSGNKLWNEAEQVSLVAMSNDSIKVLRGRYGTTAKPFSAGAYLAPHVVEGPWGNNNLLWVYNLSMNCPVDKNGKRCLDVLYDEIAGWFQPGGKLFAVDGVEFDIAPRYVTATFGRQVDQYNDRVSDNNSEKFKHDFELGVVEFYERLRRKMGNNKLIMADGSQWDSQRTTTALNGIETEGFGRYDDVYKQYFKTINAFNYWNRISFLPKLNYVTHKDVQSNRLEEFIKRERFIMAASQCLGVGFNSFIANYKPNAGVAIAIQDELVKGTDKELHWLGKPLSPYIDLSKQADDYWLGNGLNILKSSIINSSCSYQINGDNLQVNINSGASEGIITFKNVAIPDGDFTFRFNAQSESPAADFSDSIPSLVKIEMLGNLSYAHDASEINGFIGTDTLYECSYYCRDLGATHVDIKITMEGNGIMNLSGFKMNLAPQAIARAFENGVVLANPAIHDVTFNLKQLFPNRSLRRLKASPGQDMGVNNGQVVGEEVTVPGLDGLFLAVNNLNTLFDERSNNSKTGFIVNPDPAPEILNVEYPDWETQKMRAMLVDMTGEIVKLEKTINENKFQMNVRTIQPGLYVLNVVVKNFSETKLIEKQ